MWKLKGCPKCGGDLFIDKDMDNYWYAQCLQCSYYRELRNIKQVEELAHTEKKEPVATARK